MHERTSTIHETNNRVRFVWLEITGKCQLECSHCYADSGPQGDHGTMTLIDWQDVLDEAKVIGVRMVQFIGGEPTMHPHLPELIDYALALGLKVEVYTNLVSVSDAQWDRFRKPGVQLATSFYSGDRDQHEAIVRRDTLRQTQRNIEKAVREGLPIRIGQIDVLDGQDIAGAQEWLRSLGLEVDPYVDRVRGVGRGTASEPNMDALCGNCSSDVLAVGPTGLVWPCVFSRFMPMGNVKATSLTRVVNSAKMISTRDRLNREFSKRQYAVACPPRESCSPDSTCYPDNKNIVDTCRPYDTSVCNPDLCNPEKCRPGKSHHDLEDNCRPTCSPNGTGCTPACSPSCMPSHHVEAHCNPDWECIPGDVCKPKQKVHMCTPAEPCEPLKCNPKPPHSSECNPTNCGPQNNCQPGKAELVMAGGSCNPMCQPFAGCRPWNPCNPES